MKDGFIRDGTGKIIGKEDAKYIRDGQGAIKGKYDEADDRTRDRQGKIEGSGDQRLRLLKDKKK